MSAPTAGPALRLDFVEDGIARITFDQPGSRANTLSRGVQTEFENLLTQLEATPDLKGVILCSGKPGMFIAGADLKELVSLKPGQLDARALTLRGLGFIGRFEKLPCPTVVLIDGATMGGGTETSLAFDYRLMGTHPKAEMGLPETKIGILPGWGGTQRLPRLIGPSLAIEIICTGEPVKATKASLRHRSGLGRGAIGPNAERGIAHLGHVARIGRMDEHSGSQAASGRIVRGASAVHVRGRQGPDPGDKTKERSPLRWPHCLTPSPRAAILRLEEGFKIETEHFSAASRQQSISRNLIAIFFMTQRLAKDPGVADVRPCSQGTCSASALIGAGIAWGARHRRAPTCAKASPTVMNDVSAEALAKGVGSGHQGHPASRIEIGRATQSGLRVGARLAQHNDET